MTGPEHYREAERLLVHTDRSVRDRFSEGDGPPTGAECARQQIAMAQAHATLALAAATALSLPHPEAGLNIADVEQWEDAAAVQSGKLVATDDRHR